MTKILTILTLTLALWSCNFESKPAVKIDPYGDLKIERPADIPDTFCSGKPIHWDVIWQSAYDDGRIKVKKSEEGCVTWIGLRGE